MTIEAYLVELEHELRRRRAPSRRLLVEAADHLHSCAEELGDEDAAVARFGCAAIVADRYALAVAASTTRRAALAVAAAFVVYAGAALAYAATAPSWLVDFPQTAPSSVALPVAAVALVLGAFSALGGQIRVRLVARGVAVAAGAVAFAATAELVLALTRPAPAPWRDALTLLLVYALAGLGAVAALPAALLALSRASALASAERGDAGT